MSQEKKYIDPVSMAMQGLSQKAADEELDMTEFQEIFEFLDQQNKNVIITGKAGTGKSTLLKYFLTNSKKTAVVLAPTGIAAINVGGQTIHSLFMFKPEIQLVDSIKPNYKRASLFKKIDMIIIDEISMVRADTMDAMDMSLRAYRDIDLPFGNVQMVFFGDLFQLPPVVSNSEKEVFSHLYKSPYFFDSHVMKECEFTHVELNNIYRQQDQKFIKFLNKVREGVANQIDINRTINARVNDDKFDESECITLTTTKDIAAHINDTRLKEIKNPPFTFTAIISGNFEASHYPTDESLMLKVGAQVMMIKNDSEGRWVNGSMGTIVGLKDDAIVVRIKGNNHDVKKEKWEKIKYDIQKKEKQTTIDRIPVGTFEQYPIKLAYAVTIHKSQGLTFDKVIIDMGRGGFAHGQTYVALSRCKTLEGIKLTRAISQRDIIVDSRIISFMKKNLKDKEE